MAWENKEQDDDEVYFDEWGEKIGGKKYGRVKLKDIFKNEFVYYPTITKNEIKRLVNQLPELSDLSDQDLKNILIIREGDRYFDLNKIKNRKLNLKEIKEIFGNIKTKKDLLNDNGELKSEINIDLNIYGFDIKEQKNGITIDIWKKEEGSYTEVKHSTVMRKYRQYLENEGLIIRNLNELIDSEGNLKLQFQELFDEKNIYYDIEEDKFYDHTQKLSKKLIYLIPEKHFREQSSKAIDIHEYENNNKALIDNVKQKLNELLRDL